MRLNHQRIRILKDRKGQAPQKESKIFRNRIVRAFSFIVKHEVRKRKHKLKAKEKQKLKAKSKAKAKS